MENILDKIEGYHKVKGDSKADVVRIGEKIA